MTFLPPMTESYWLEMASNCPLMSTLVSAVGGVNTIRFCRLSIFSSYRLSVELLSSIGPKRCCYSVLIDSISCYMSISLSVVSFGWKVLPYPPV